MIGKSIERADCNLLATAAAVEGLRMQQNIIQLISNNRKIGLTDAALKIDEDDMRDCNQCNAKREWILYERCWNQFILTHRIVTVS